jgi:hypothetical protein
MNTYTKNCTKCGISKPLTFYFKQASMRDGHQKQCKLCSKKQNGLYRIDHIDTIRSLAQANYNINKKEICEKNKVRYYKNIEKSREYNRIYTNTKLKEDMLFKLRHNLRNLIRNSLVGNGFSKRTKTFQILGCSFNDFKCHIEQQFCPGMLWENYGKWEYDHIIPVSSATSETEIIVLNHYTNFQPLWKEHNRSKSNKIGYCTL